MEKRSNRTNRKEKLITHNVMNKMAYGFLIFFTVMLLSAWYFMFMNVIYVTKDICIEYISYMAIASSIGYLISCRAHRNIPCAIITTLLSVISYDVIALLRYRNRKPGLEMIGLLFCIFLTSVLIARKYASMRIKSKVRTIIENVIIVAELLACFFLSFTAVTQRQALNMNYYGFFMSRDYLVKIDTSGYETETMFDHNIKIIAKLDQGFISIEKEEEKKEILSTLITQICYDLGLKDTIPRIEFGDEIREAELIGYYDQHKDTLYLSAKYIESGSGWQKDRRYSEELIHTAAYLMYFRKLKYEIELLNYLEDEQLERYSRMFIFDPVKEYRDELKNFISYDQSVEQYEAQRIVKEAKLFSEQTVVMYEEKIDEL